ncbi:MAG TPA: VCBS repeat-containing protein [Bryobacteraceae bacterium]|nr:VCBS repeat-containing protein [Bryobacteraceae bacterium]
MRHLIRRLPVCGSLLSVVALLAASPPSAVEFNSPRLYAAGGQSPVAADFNRDGILDVATTGTNGSETHAISVSLGDGLGGFAAPVFYEVGKQPICMATGDFNGDGIADLAVGNLASKSVSVLLGNGDGTFQAQKILDLSSRPSFIATGDFNGDGKADLAVGNGDHDIYVFLSNGDGTFRPSAYFALSSSVGGVAADFNGDGKTDLAVGCGSGLVMVLGNGDGTFQPPVFYSGYFADGIAVADFNGDGHLDVALTTDLYLVTWMGKGDGTFYAGASIYLSDGFGLSAGDFNHDGKPDLAVTTGSGQVVIMMGGGDGGFVESGRYIDGGSDAPVLADFNGDGNLDIAVPSFSAFGILLGDGLGNFQHVTNYATLRYPQALAVGNFDGDGTEDMAVAAGTQNVSILLGNGKTHNYGLPFQATSVAVADFNRDGKLDVAAGLAILLGNGDGTFHQVANYGAASAVVAADFNGDGIPDVAGVGPNSNYILVRLGNGDGTFQAPKSFGLTKVAYLAAGDFDGDGNLDLAAVVGTREPSVTAPPASISILLGNGDGTFRAGQSITFPNSGLTSVALADFNRDGALDLAVPVWGSTGASNISIFFGDGHGGFGAPARYPVGDAPTNIAVADLNGDGVPDIAAGGLGNAVWILPGKSDGTFQVQLTSYMVGPFSNLGPPNSQAMAVLDFNGDGKPDVAAVNYTSAAISVLTNLTPR